MLLNGAMLARPGRNSPLKRFLTAPVIAADGTTYAIICRQAFGEIGLFDIYLELV